MTQKWRIFRYNEDGTTTTEEIIEGEFYTADAHAQEIMYEEGAPESGVEVGYELFYG